MISLSFLTENIYKHISPRNDVMYGAAKFRVNDYFTMKTRLNNKIGIISNDKTGSLSLYVDTATCIFEYITHPNNENIRNKIFICTDTDIETVIEISKEIYDYIQIVINSHIGELEKYEYTETN